MSVVVENAGSIAIVKIDRQQQLNAVDSRTVAELRAVLTRLDDNVEDRVVIMTGAGERSFVAGGDVREMRDLGLHEAAAFVYAGQGMTRLIELMRKPVIAAINGLALGGGMEIALACDLRVASSAAVFGLPEVTLGLLPGWGGTQRAVRVLGRARALELILTGRRVDAAEALAIGLVHRVVPPEELMPVTIELANTLARNSPVALQQAKKAIHRGADAALEVGLALEAEAWLYLVAHPDRTEGLTALLEKRPPRWST